MHFDLKEVLSAWISKVHPTEEQKRLAEQRAKVCSSCEFMKEMIKDSKSLNYCGSCGCILAAKVYSSKEGACPKGKWNGIDATFRNTQALKVLKDPKKLI